jgi:hypothetical protein
LDRIAISPDMPGDGERHGFNIDCSNSRGGD